MSAALNNYALKSLAEVMAFQTQYQLPLAASDDELLVDYFCGGGGAGTGLEMGLGRSVDIAKNHNPNAISMHMVNHPKALHLSTDVFSGDPRVETGGRRVGWFHMSPDCTHHSQAAGGQPRVKAIRDLSWIGCKWAGLVRPRVISLENVVQILNWSPLIAKRDPETGRVIKLWKVIRKNKNKTKTKKAVAAPGEVVSIEQQHLIPDPKRKGETWRRFVRQLEGLGYQVEWRALSACDYGAPTTRKRLYMIARCDGQQIEWPEATHAQEPNSRQQPWRAAHECIDWTIPSQSIFEREKPLAEATLRRIAKGAVKYVLNNPKPFMVPVTSYAAVSPLFAPLTHHGSDRTNDPQLPMPTVTGANRGELALIAPYLVQANGGFNATPAHSVRRPVSTITNTGSQQQLITASLATLRRNCVGLGLDEVIPTITASGGHHSLIEYQLSPQEEAGALRVSGFLLQYYSTGGQLSDLAKPANTITTKDRLALVTVVLQGTPYVIVDIRLRMLQPHELYAAQGFPLNYEIRMGHDGRIFTKTEQVKMCGNSVSPPVMAALAAANDPWKYSVLESQAA